MKNQLKTEVEYIQRFLIDLWMILGPFLEPFSDPCWDPFGGPLGHQWVDKPASMPPPSPFWPPTGGQREARGGPLWPAGGQGARGGPTGARCVPAGARGGIRGGPVMLPAHLSVRESLQVENTA